jgi:REP element-mobilizing transposase RayT
MERRTLFQYCSRQQPPDDLPQALVTPVISPEPVCGLREFSYTRKRVGNCISIDPARLRAAEIVSYTNLLVHIVFGTKGRLPIINAEIRPRLHSYIGATVRGLGGTALEINGIHDHVHILLKLKPTILLSDFVRDLKSNTSTWAKDNGVPKFAWQRRYGALTVSESQAADVRNYIRNQERHHKKFDFKTEFETMLASNGIPIDEFTWQE